MEQLLGIAMGCMGMSMDDFGRCAPSEFYAAYEAWQQRELRLERGAWERMRMQCLCSLQPYSKSKLQPTDIITLPWDEEPRQSAAESPQEPLSRDEIMARYREAKKKRGMT